VSLLLRKPILQEEDMLYTVAAAEAGLIYTDEVSRALQHQPCLCFAYAMLILCLFYVC
jgi:hypothetical protein